MASYDNLRSTIQQYIKTNGNNEITGAILQSVLLAMITSLGDGYQFKGLATPSTAPGTPDQKVFYLGGNGSYSNFGTAVNVPKGSLVIFMYNGAWTNSILDIDLLSVFDLVVQSKLTNGYISTAGAYVSSDSYRCTDYMPVVPTLEYISTVTTRISCFDESKTFLGYVSRGETLITGTKYVRCFWLASAATPYFVSEDTTSIRGRYGSKSDSPLNMDDLLSVRGIFNTLKAVQSQLFTEQKNQYANLGSAAVGSAYTTVISSGTGWTYIDIPVNPGDVFFGSTFNNTANAKAYGIFDANNVCLALHQAAISDQVLIMPENAARLIVNTNMNMGGSLIALFRDIIQNAQNVNDAILLLNKTIFGTTTSFRAFSAQQTLSPPIENGDVITSITGANWTNINLYDENGNSTQIQPGMLPYTATKKYVGASTYISGNPTLNINIQGLIDKIALDDYPQNLSKGLSTKGVFATLDKVAQKYFIEKKGQYINLGSAAVGSAYTTVISGASAYSWEDIPVTPGDIFIISTYANTNNAKCYAILDANNICLALQTAEIRDTILTMPENAARLIVNSRYADGPILIKNLGAIMTIIDVIKQSRLTDLLIEFKANGQSQTLASPIESASVISTISGASWTNINLYDENGNSTQIQPGMLPYKTTKKYVGASTYISGSPTLVITVDGLTSMVSKLTDVVIGNMVKAAIYEIANHDNDFIFDNLFAGQFVTSLLQMQPNFELPTDGAYISTDVENIGIRTEPVNVENLLRAFVPYLYIDGAKRGTMVLFDESGQPFIFDASGNKRLIQLV